jgi:hypothetical protein
MEALSQSSSISAGSTTKEVNALTEEVQDTIATSDMD